MSAPLHPSGYHVRTPVYRGKPIEYTDAELKRYALLDKSKPTIRTPLCAFTPRALEYLRLLCEGYSYKEIAAKIGVSQNTVTRRLAVFRARVGARNAVDLVLYCIACGIVQMETLPNCAAALRERVEEDGE